ncbi:serine/threonine-protein kinase pelle-like protein, partial [Dinothrombium tinctorium]
MWWDQEIASISNEYRKRRNYEIILEYVETETGKGTKVVKIEEKMQRRKLKNRVAAQSARDRKKQKMTELEHSLQILNNEKLRLMQANRELFVKNENLKKENEELKKCLSKDGSASIESAELINVCLLHGQVLSHEQIVDMLVKCSPHLLESDKCDHSLDKETCEDSKSILSPMVGTARNKLQAINDCINDINLNENSCLAFPVKQEVLDVDENDDDRIPFPSEEVIVPHTIENFVELPELLSPPPESLSDSGYESAASPTSSSISIDEAMGTAFANATAFDNIAFSFEPNEDETVKTRSQNSSKSASLPRYVYDLPYNVRKSLCDLLDADGSWRQLGGEHMRLNDTQLTLISHALYRGASPTNDLLVRWEQSNAKVTQLFVYLAAMKHRRAMLILKPYVNGKLAALCDDGPEEDINHLGAVGFAFDTVKKNQNLNKLTSEEKIINKEWNNLDAKNEAAKSEVEKSGKELESSNLSSIQSLISQLDQEELEVSYKELLLSTDDFSSERIIGSGGFGIVYKGIWKGTQVAIKRLKGCENMSQAVTELRYLNRYRIDNILPLYGISLDGAEACLVYQFMPNGSLEDRLLCKNSTPPLTWLQRALIGEGIAKALNYLHTLKGKPLVHGDVKSANVLLDAQFEPKLGDFGLARQIIGSTGDGMYTHITVSSVHGTSVYLPPEYLRQKILSPAVDVYSYGIVMLEMATGRRAFDGKRLLVDLVEDELKTDEEEEGKRGAIRLRDAKLGENADGEPWFDSLIKLGTDCAHKVKRKRPTMVQILEYYEQCKTRDRIRRLSVESKRVSPIPNEAEIKTPLELQLWYDLVKKQSTLSTPTSTQPQSAHIDHSEDAHTVIPLLTELGFNNNDS